MNCFRQVFSCLYYAYGWLQEPETSPDNPNESVSWKHPPQYTSNLWSDVQMRKEISKPLSALIEKSLSVLESRNIQTGVAVDLGCGISPTVYNLLERGWKVYAVDSSIHVLSDLSSQISSLRKKWFETGQLVLISENMEDFKFPEKIHLVIATDSLAYCNPQKIQGLFSRIKAALLPGGLFVCNLYSSKDHKVQQIFGAWTTKKSVIENILRSLKFSCYLISEDYQFQKKPVFQVIAS